MFLFFEFCKLLLIRRNTSDSALPARIRDVFQRVADAIRRVYGKATGNTQLPQNIQDVFNSFFWNDENTDIDTTASVNTADSMANSEVIRNQPMREGYKKRKE